MKKQKVFFLGALGVVTALSAIVMIKPMNLFITHAEDAQPYSLTLTKNSKADAALPDTEGAVVAELLEYEEDEYNTIQFYRCTQHNTHYMRLNKRANSEEPSYFTKKEPSYGMTSITVGYN